MRLAWAAALLLAAAPAAGYELEQVLVNLEKADKNVKAIRFDFVQDVRFTEMGASTVVTGQAVFAKPNRMRIEKKQPDEQITVSNGKKMWVYNPAFKQVWEGNWQSWVDAKILPQGLVPIGGYVSDLRKRFDLTLEQNAGEGVRIDAQPKQRDLGYSLEIVVSTATWMPSRTVYKSDSAVVETKLTQIGLNPAVKDADFRFTAPPGVDVIPLN